MKSDMFFETIDKLLSFGKKLFYFNLEKVEETNLAEYTDIFGNQLEKDELVIPLLYNEIARCGYVTITHDYEKYAINAYKMNDKFAKVGVIRLNDFDNSLDDFLKNIDNKNSLFKVKMSKRKGMYHVLLTPKMVLPQYRHRTA